MLLKKGVTCAWRISATSTAGRPTTAAGSAAVAIAGPLVAASRAAAQREWAPRGDAVATGGDNRRVRQVGVAQRLTAQPPRFHQIVLITSIQHRSDGGRVQSGNDCQECSFHPPGTTFPDAHDRCHASLLRLENVRPLVPLKQIRIEL
jgi:hypothetical protein